MRNISLQIKQSTFSPSVINKHRLTRLMPGATQVSLYYRPLGYERVYLPLCKMADTRFHIYPRGRYVHFWNQTRVTESTISISYTKHLYSVRHYLMDDVVNRSTSKYYIHPISVYPVLTGLALVL